MLKTDDGKMLEFVLERADASLAVHPGDRAWVSLDQAEHQQVMLIPTRHGAAWASPVVIVERQLA